MLFWILCGVGAALFITTVILNVRGLNPNTGFALFVGGGGLLLCIQLIVTALAPVTLTSRETHTTTYPLTAVKAATAGKVEGNFFLGIGHVKGDTTETYSYYYAKRDTQGRTYQASATAPAALSRVYEDSATDPNVRHTVEIRQYGNAAILPFPIDQQRSEHYDFTVPEDSVVRAFNLN